MEVRKEDFPVVVQAFDTSGNADVFIAEQVVNSQLEIDSFTSRYTGKLIKARRLTEAEHSREHTAHSTTTTRRGTTVGTYIAIVIILIIVALVVVGFTTGWIQSTFNIQMFIQPGSLLFSSV